MPVQEPVDSYTLVDGGGTLSVLNDIVTAAAFQSRFIAGRAHDDKGAGAIVTGYRYRSYFELSAFGTSQIVVPIMTANAVGDAFQLFIGAPDASLIWFQKASNIWSILHLHGASAFERADSVFPLTLNNRYAIDKIRTGQSITGNLYDIGGAHGVPGTQVDTKTLVCAQPLLDHRFLYAVSGFDDNASVNTVSGTFELWDMNAVAGGIVPPALFQGASL